MAGVVLGGRGLILQRWQVVKLAEVNAVGGRGRSGRGLVVFLFAQGVEAVEIHPVEGGEFLFLRCGRGRGRFWRRFTLEEIQIEASKVPAFKAGKALKDAVKN